MLLACRACQAVAPQQPVAGSCLLDGGGEEDPLARGGAAWVRRWLWRRE